MEEQMKYLEKIEELNKKLTSAQEEIEKLNAENEKLNAENETLSNAKPVIELNRKLNTENEKLKEQSEKDKKDCEKKLNELNNREEVLAGKERQYQADRNNLDGVIRKRTNEGINEYIEKNKAYVAEKKGIIERNVKEAEIDREKAVEELAQARKEAEKIRAQRRKEWVPVSAKGILFCLAILAIIGYLAYWGVLVHIAEAHSETLYGYRAPKNEDEKILSADETGQIPLRASYIKALIEAELPKNNKEKTIGTDALKAVIHRWGIDKMLIQNTPKSQKKQRRR